MGTPAFRARHRAVSLLLTVAALIMATVNAAPAYAHNVLISTRPANGSVVAHTPTDVVLTFDNPALQPGTALVITGPAGPAQQGSPTLINTTVTQPLRPGSPAGTYHVAWRATSVDGHPVSGQFTFTAAASSTATTTATAASGGPAQSLAPRPATTSGGAPLLPALAALLAAAAGLIVFVRLRRRSRLEPPQAEPGNDTSGGT